MRRYALFLLAATALACAPRRPPFVEPDWGDAPPPYAVEITEVTREYRHCAAECSSDRLVIRRDGRVERRFVTSKRVDSVLVARIDSLAFVNLVEGLVRARLFRPMEGAGEQVPLAVDSYLVTAASLCRRAVATYSPLASDWSSPGSTAVLLIERTIRQLQWTPPRAFQLSSAVPRSAS